MQSNNNRKFWIIFLMFLAGPLSFLTLFSPELRKEGYVRIILACWIFISIVSLSPITAVIGLNTTLFLDNLLMQSQAISPIILWSILGTLIGLVYGTVVAWRKYTLDSKLILIPAALLSFFVVILFFLNSPLQAGTWTGELATQSTVSDTQQTDDLKDASHQQSAVEDNKTGYQTPDLIDPDLTVSAEVTYSGAIGRLNAIYNIQWMSDGSIAGTYYYTSRADVVYTLKGKESGDKVYLTEYTNGSATGNCTLYVNDLCFSGNMSNAEGTNLEMKMCEHSTYQSETSSSANEIEVSVPEVDALSEEVKVFTFVEQNPTFPGGDGELLKFIQANLRYPQMELDNDIQGKVLIRFVVMEDGTTSNVTVMRKVSPGLDAEAIRLVESLPKFKPGYQQGKPVRVYFNIPIVFKLP